MSKGLAASHNITSSLAWATAIACLSTLQFGYHLAELNTVEGIISCQFHKPGPYESYDETIWSQYGFKQCIPMSGNGVATITTMFTVGGLVGSIIVGSSKISSNYGRKYICMINSGLYILGSIIMMLSNSILVFNLGRFINGLAAGSSLVISPILINELTPVNHRGLLGSLLQLAVAVGILTAQLVGYVWANDQQWRHIFIFAMCIGFLQWSVLFTTVESPKWIILNKGDVHGAKKILKDLRTDHEALEHEVNHWRRLSNKTSTRPQELNETSALLDEPVCINSSEDITSQSSIPLSTYVSRRGSIDPDHLTIGEFLTNKKYRHEKLAIFGLMTAQQLCGINAITFYGVRILSSIVPQGTNVLVITCSLSFFNVIIALIGAPFVDRLGRKPLLLSSTIIMGLAAFVIACGLINSCDLITATACFAFIFGYSIGLSPIPFLMVSELTDHEALGAAQSVGAALNWTSNIAIAFFFPILKDLFEGYVFFGFFTIAIFYVIYFWSFLPETKNHHSAEEVWKNWQQ